MTTNNILNSNNVNSIITDNITTSDFFSDFDRNFISVLDEVERLDRHNNIQPSPSLESQYDIELDYSNIFTSSSSDSVTQMLLSPYNNISQENVDHLYSLLFPSNSILNNINTVEENSLYDKNPIKKLISEDGKKQLTKLKYTTSCKNHTCPILYSEFNEGEDIIKLPCGHCFNPEAIETWLNKEKAECPVCRFQLHYKESCQ